MPAAVSETGRSTRGLRARFASATRPVQLTLVLPVMTALKVEAIARARSCRPEEVLREGVVAWILREERHLNRRHRHRVERLMSESEDWTPIDDLLRGALADWREVA
jgi:hypothetical protein